MACSAAAKGQGTNGSCGVGIAGKDDKNQCAAQLRSACGTDGYCDGAGACRLSPAGPPCRITAGACDVQETCPGAGAACPPDGEIAQNTPCPSGADTNPC